MAIKVDQWESLSNVESAGLLPRCDGIAIESVSILHNYYRNSFQSSEFFATYDSEMHTITTEMESRLRVDKILLEVPEIPT